MHCCMSVQFVLYLFVSKSRLHRPPLRRRYRPDARAASYTGGDLQPQRSFRSTERGGAQYAVAVAQWDGALRAGQ